MVDFSDYLLFCLKQPVFRLAVQAPQMPIRTNVGWPCSSTWVPKVSRSNKADLDPFSVFRWEHQPIPLLCICWAIVFLDLHGLRLLEIITSKSFCDSYPVYAVSISKRFLGLLDASTLRPRYPMKAAYVGVSETQQE